MSQFATALELARYMNGDTALAEGDLDNEFVVQANILLEMISADIEAEAGVNLEGGTTTAILPGTWSRELILPVGPITAVSAVLVNGTELAAAEYAWNDRSLLLRGYDLNDIADRETDDLRPQGAGWAHGYHWGGPTSTVRVTLVYALDEVPDVVKSLALRIAARTIGNTGDVTQESLAIYSVTYRNRSADSGSHVSRRERMMLRRLFNRTGGTIRVGA